MTRNEIETIVKTPFPGIAERMNYCVHCLNPMIAARNMQEEDLLGPAFTGPLKPEFRAGTILQRNFPQLFDEVSVRYRGHDCPDCPRWEDPENRRDGVVDDSYFEGEKVICCPTCLLPIHPGEGPWTAEGYRAELLRRATGENLKAQPETVGAYLAGIPGPLVPEPPVGRKAAVDPDLWAGI